MDMVTWLYTKQSQSSKFKGYRRRFTHIIVFHTQKAHPHCSPTAQGHSRRNKPPRAALFVINIKITTIIITNVHFIIAINYTLYVLRTG